MMDEELKETIEFWNDFIDNLIEARDTWEVINQRALEGLNIQEAPVPFQKMISMFGKARFTVALPRMIDWIRMYSSLEEVKAPLDSEEASPLAENNSLTEEAANGRR